MLAETTHVEEEEVVIVVVVCFICERIIFLITAWLVCQKISTQKVRTFNCRRLIDDLIAIDPITAPQ